MCFKAAERLQMIGLMVVMFMSYSRVVLVLCGVDPNLRNGYRISGQNVF